MSNFIRLLFSFLAISICLLALAGSMGYSEQVYPNMTMGAVCYTINNTTGLIGESGSVMVTISIMVLFVLVGIALAYAVYGYVTN